MVGGARPCVFCQIAQSSTSNPLLHTDDRVVAFPDIKPSAFRHYLVIPVEHISTVNDLQRREEDHCLVIHMLKVGQTLLHRDAPGSKLYRSGGKRNGFEAVWWPVTDEVNSLMFCSLPAVDHEKEEKPRRFGFHQPPFNSVNHLHLHCFALPFMPRWKKFKYTSLGPLGGFIEAEKLLQRIKPLAKVDS